MTESCSHKIYKYISLIAILLIFLTMFIMFGYIEGLDTPGYVEGIPMRNGLYPFILLVIRTLTNPFTDNHFYVVALIQNILSAVSIWVLGEYIAEKISDSVLSKTIIHCIAYVMLLAPWIMWF